jgi:hypothetical protein
VFPRFFNARAAANAAGDAFSSVFSVSQWFS